VSGVATYRLTKVFRSPSTGIRTIKRG
jgi:hypothetical protein